MEWRPSRVVDVTAGELKSGFLVKRPVHGHLFSKPRRRYFILTERKLEWFLDDQSTNQPKLRKAASRSTVLDVSGRPMARSY